MEKEYEINKLIYNKLQPGCSLYYDIIINIFSGMEQDENSTFITYSVLFYVIKYVKFNKL